ncbi:hypothetical protein FUA23_03005 [Neolewinella aurantiaca]|uniref:Cytochrome c domain-containing protein n=1 Tax=Neolewinella aurantiaca TaxID=2602767 RepID=A0A5C7FSY1_9BACT|nr:hypothetical protein [Neolewinella aurantiaca]TXF91207.1 hypothetical protein FUA23_03005 [Neolewinella aurantiaca]
MRPAYDTLRAMLTTINFVAGVLFCCLFWLLAGDAVTEMLRPRPVMEQKAYRPGTGGGGEPEEKVTNGIHDATGLIFAEGFEAVRGNCTACHSAKLITQNRATAAGWTEIIRWMQATQNLHDLGENEEIIVKYLATNYAPEDVGRRAGLDVESIEWYLLELE